MREYSVVSCIRSRFALHALDHEEDHELRSYAQFMVFRSILHTTELSFYQLPKTLLAPTLTSKFSQQLLLTDTIFNQKTVVILPVTCENKIRHFR